MFMMLFQETVGGIWCEQVANLDFQELLSPHVAQFFSFCCVPAFNYNFDAELVSSHFCTKVIAEFLEEHQKHYNVVGNFFVHIQTSSHNAHLFCNAGCCLYDSHF